MKLNIVVDVDVDPTLEDPWDIANYLLDPTADDPTYKFLSAEWDE